MKLLIDIPKVIYEMVMNTGTFGCYRFNTSKTIKNGIPCDDLLGLWKPITSNDYPKDHSVLACNIDGDMIVGYLRGMYEQVIWCEIPGTDASLDNIVAYMEEPEPYKKGGE